MFVTFNEVLASLWQVNHVIEEFCFGDKVCLNMVEIRIYKPYGMSVFKQILLKPTIRINSVLK
jgi:hypothetical protein